MSRILSDADGVLVNWGLAWNQAMDGLGERAINIPRHEQQVTFNLNAGRTQDERKLIAEVMSREGFYRDLEPIPGAKQALKEMLKAGHDVRIVTSPWVSNPTCASDKFNWFVRHYGAQWGQRVIITTDKTLVRGDYLIDDRPEVTGVETPVWEHVLFDQPYNRSVEGRKRIVNWRDWESVIG